LDERRIYIVDITTILGIVAGFGFIVYGIGFANMSNFIDPGSVYITIGGAIACILASFPFRVLAKIPQHFKIAFVGKSYNPAVYIEKIFEMAKIARKSGLLALENKANEEKDEFLKSSLLMIVDAIEAEKIRSSQESVLYNMTLRHNEGMSIYEKGAAFGPAFGMIGTLVGLINMLKALNLDEGGSDTLGAGMSLALITTFYGSVFANLICMPIANKLQVKHEEEMLAKQLILEGILSIQSGENPNYIKEKLTSMLPVKGASKKTKAKTDAKGTKGANAQGANVKGASEKPGGKK
jgi:chemotaxis protein MotA